MSDGNWKFWSRIAWRLPKKLVYWCLIRAGGHATTGRFSGQIVPDLTYFETLERWGEK